ncbi:spore coat protein U domain-containing protein [Deinococcus marmoris]|uniref:Spore coat protein U/FanG domain-containing protein n=1 Tax=Deinococcus marmoris TaxID=249408 RepID=A0A1U7P0C3_9DEIO|nr:hypothetical protein [Deinococcus marmoris]OLV18627.1 hypothetical protein BOO71_0005215 [Deinococcus marmoris]
MRLKFVPVLLAAALGVATAIPIGPSAPIAINANVQDACEITAAPSITFSYEAASATAITGGSDVSVHCNQDTTFLAGYWNDTQANADGTVDLIGPGGQVLQVKLDTEFDPIIQSSDATDGSRLTFGITATAEPGQWTAAVGAYSATFDYFVGW